MTTSPSSFSRLFSPIRSLNSLGGAEAAFLQERLRHSAFWTFVLGGLAIKARLLGLFNETGPWWPLSASMWAHVASVVIQLAIWVICMGPQRSQNALRWVDFIGHLVTISAYTFLVITLPHIHLTHQYIVHMAATYTLVARAALVPSGSRRTLVLSVLSGVMVIGVCFLIENPALRMPALRMAAVWWSITMLLGAGISHVTFGLRQEVRDARKFGQYTLEKKIGEGGMGVVYRAKHGMLRRPTALKLLPPERLSEASIARFEREVRLCARLSHPNTVTIFDFGRTPDGILYYAMELLNGANVETVVTADGPQCEARVHHILLQVAGALAEAHDAELVHRDVKPQNIFLCCQGGVPDIAKLLDFGLVREIRPQEGHLKLTHDGKITGTPLYMSPEAIIGDELTARTDIYSLGCVGYYLLTGQHVFEARTALEVCSHHLQTPPTPPSQRLGRTESSPLELVILSCLAKNPDERPQNGRELRKMLLTLPRQSWSDLDADAWWDNHREQLLAASDSRDDLTGESLQIDLKRR